MNNQIKNFALIIGAMKCGTTSLYYYLAQHPEISMCRKKEIGFFWDSRFFSKGLDYYQNQFTWNPNLHKIALDVDANYTSYGCGTTYYKLNAAESIVKVKKDTNVNFKFIYIIRNPVDRIQSHYNHSLAYLREDVCKPDFEVTKCSYMIALSRYAMQLDEYYKRFDTDNILLLNFDDFKAEPLNVLKKICYFLEIDPNYEFKDLDIHNCYDSHTRIVLPGYSLIRKSELMELILRQIPDSMLRKLRIFFKLFYSKPPKMSSYVKLSTEQRQCLLNELQIDLHKLNREYGFDISRWSNKI